MAAIITDREGDKTTGDRPWWQRLLWFVVLWGAGVLALFAVGSTIRYFMFP